MRPKGRPLGVTEVSRLMNISANHVRYLADRGAIASTRDKNNYRCFTPEAVNEALRRRADLENARRAAFGGGRR